MKRIFRTIGEAVAALLIVAALLEIFLRLFPGLVPLSLLVNFQENLRQEIARRAGLPAAANTLPVERDDNGPPLRVYRPHATVEVPFDADDVGAVKSVSMDKNGFCNPPAAAELASVDIITVGDSFTWCVGVRPEDGWWSRLAASSGRSAYSLGIGGIGPYEELQLLKRFGVSKSPRVVVMNIYGGNDIRGATKFFEYRERLAARDGKPHLVDACVGLPGPVCTLYRTLKEGPIGRNSYAFNLASNATRDGILRVRRMFGSAEPAEEPSFRYRVRIGGEDILFNRGNADLDDLEYAERLENGNISLMVFGEALKNFVALARRHEFLPVVSFTPAAYAVYADRIVFEDAAAGERIQRFSDSERQYFAEKAGEYGYVFVDFTPALRAATTAGDGLLYFPSNVHLTAAGHAVVGETLSVALLQRGILR